MTGDRRDENLPRVTALLLAGSRPGTDPLAAAFHAPAKALVSIDGEAMLSRVARTLAEHPGVSRVIVLAQDIDALRAHRDTAWLTDHSAFTLERGVDSVSRSVAEALERHGGDYPFLVTTADHALLDEAMLDAFIEPARAAAADVVVGVVERAVLEARYPANRRTWLRFRGGSYSGANLFLLTGPRALPALRMWSSIEQQRKRGRAIVAAFGPVVLAAVGLRLVTLEGALRRAGRKLGIKAAAVSIPIAEACIDVDSVADHALATSILESRRHDP